MAQPRALQLQLQPLPFARIARLRVAASSPREIREVRLRQECNVRFAASIQDLRRSTPLVITHAPCRSARSVPEIPVIDEVHFTVPPNSHAWCDELHVSGSRPFESAGLPARTTKTKPAKRAPSRELRNISESVAFT